MNLLASFRAARRVSTPLMCIRTADPAATMRTISTSFNGDPPPILHWDTVAGIRGVNKPGVAAAGDLGGDPASIIGPVDALIAAAKLPPRSMLFFANAHRVIGENGVSQAVWNLRDSFKRDTRTLVMLCPTLNLPAEISQDVLMLDEPLPTEGELETIVRDIYKSTEIPSPDDPKVGIFLPPPTDQLITKAVDALCGLAAFPAEQSCAMSISESGLDLKLLWERKRSAIEQQKGLSVWRGGERFSDIGGYANLKKFLLAVLNGQSPPRGVIFLDEIEKGIGTGQDTSGVSQGLLQQLLTYMNDNDATGLLLIGPPGTSKSLFAKATGNEGGVPTIALDLGGMKGSLVGESEQALRTALKVCDAVTQKRALFIGTCNSIGALPPELRRRFNLGVVFLDLPNSSERKTIWDLYLNKYALPSQPIPTDDGWTGSEIRQCAWLAWDLKLSLQDAAEYVVPVSRSASEQISRLRDSADGRYISASYPGVFLKAGPASAQTGRKMNLEVN